MLVSHHHGTLDGGSSSDDIPFSLLIHRRPQSKWYLGRTEHTSSPPPQQPLLIWTQTVHTVYYWYLAIVERQLQCRIWTMQTTLWGRGIQVGTISPQCLHSHSTWADKTELRGWCQRPLTQLPSPAGEVLEESWRLGSSQLQVNSWHTG